jgi:hypothetical protein
MRSLTICPTHPSFQIGTFFIGVGATTDSSFQIEISSNGVNVEQVPDAGNCPATGKHAYNNRVEIYL